MFDYCSQSIATVFLFMVILIMQNYSNIICIIHLYTENMKTITPNDLLDSLLLEVRIIH